MTTSTPPITLFGATGYTGQLIAHALARAELPFRIAGRSPEKLARLSAVLPNRPEWLVADATQMSSLPPLFQGTRLLINCAGPFTDLGERVIAQAALSGVHYLDTTNELGYVFRARGYGELAQKTGAALVPACAFEVALADCAAHVCASHMCAAHIGSTHPSGAAPVIPSQADLEHQPLDEVNVVYTLDGKISSAGTRRSAVRSLATSWIAYRDGGWTGQIPGGSVRAFTFAEDGSEKKQYAYAIPSCESITIPAHLPTRRVDAWMVTAPGARFWTPILIPLLARLSRSILRGLILRIAARGGISPASIPEAGWPPVSPFTIYVEARRAEEKRAILLTGHNPYRLTAEIIAYAARQMIASDEGRGYNRRGFLAPAQAFDPQVFLDYAQCNWGISVYFREK